MAQCASLRQYISADNKRSVFSISKLYAANKVSSKKETQQEIRRVLPISQGIVCWFCFTGAETEIYKIKDNSKIKREKNIDCRSQRHFGNVWHLPDPPSFSLPTTFKWQVNNRAGHLYTLQHNL